MWGDKMRKVAGRSDLPGGVVNACHVLPPRSVGHERSFQEVVSNGGMGRSQRAGLRSEWGLRRWKPQV